MVLLKMHQSAVNGSSAAMRARLMAFCSLRWCSAQVPEMRRGRIFPRSGMNCWSVFTSLKSMYSIFSTQNLQTRLRR